MAYSVLFWAILSALALALFNILEQALLFYRQSLFKKEIEWTILEMKIPREVLQTPRSMEQFFINLYTLKNEASDIQEKYVEGEVPLWWSFEIASFGGKVHFYIRTPKKHRKMIEAALYAQYSGIEIIEASDYIKQIPVTTKEIYESNENIFSSEFVLDKENFYPIKTYEHFELSKEELALDPVSALVESLAGVHKEENIFIQILAVPANEDWKKEGEEFIKKMTGKGDSKKTSNQFLREWIRNFLMAPAEYPVWADKKEGAEKEKFSLFQLTPGQQDLIKAIENKLSKHGFEVLIRFLYIAPNPIFNVNFAIRGIRGALNQYASPSFNFFKHNFFAWPIVKWNSFPYILIPKRSEARKQRLLYNYINRKLAEESSFGKFFTSHVFNFNNKSKNFILDTSELATIFHVPGERVLTSPHIERMESKKMGPPAGLPIFEEE